MQIKLVKSYYISSVRLAKAMDTSADKDTEKLAHSMDREL